MKESKEKKEVARTGLWLWVVIGAKLKLKSS